MALCARRSREEIVEHHPDRDREGAKPTPAVERKEEANRAHQVGRGQAMEPLALA